MTRIAEAGRLLALAAPIAAAYVGHVGMGWVDTAIVGRVGKDALAGIGLGASITTVVSLLGLGIVSGLDPVAAQRIGAGERPRARDALRHALWLVIPIAVLLGILGITLDRVLLVPSLHGALAGALPGANESPWIAFEPEVARLAHEYLWSRLPGHLPYTAFVVFRSWLYADHRPGPVLWATLVANIVHLAAGWACVFGAPALWVPEFGPVATGWVTSISYLISILCLVPAMHRDLGTRGSPRTESRRAGCLRIVTLGLPIGLQMTLDSGVFMAVALLMNKISPLWGGAHQITNQLVAFTFVVAVGLGSAASVRVGQAIGRGDATATRLAGITATWLGLVWMGAMGTVLWLAAEPLARVFTGEAGLIAAARELIRIAALFQVFDGLQAVCSGIARGAGMTRFPFVANLVGQWVIGLPLGYWLAFECGFGGPGLWAGLTAGIVAVGVLLAWRTQRVLARGVRPLA